MLLLLDSFGKYDITSQELRGLENKYMLYLALGKYVEFYAYEALREV